MTRHFHVTTARRHKNPAHSRRTLCPLAGLSVHAALHRSRRPARGLYRRRSACRTRRALDAWGAELVVSLPQDDSGVFGRRLPCRRARYSRFRSLRQAGAQGRLFVPEPCAVDEGLAGTGRSAPGHAVLPGLGLADRTAHGGGTAGPIRAHRAGQWRAADRHRRDAQGVPDLARLCHLQPLVSDWAHCQSRLCSWLDATGSGVL